MDKEAALCWAKSQPMESPAYQLAFQVDHADLQVESMDRELGRYDSKIKSLQASLLRLNIIHRALRYRFRWVILPIERLDSIVESWRRFRS